MTARSFATWCPTSRRWPSGSRAVDYLVDEGLATSMFLSLRLPQPLLLEGEAGVGKTEAARSLAAVLDTPLIRLQCYEGIDAAEALYEWNYPRQLLSIRLADSSDSTLSEEELFGPDYLIRRPLLRALEHPGPRPAVLLIDEIDRADDDFEAFLLELLADASVTIPELGTITATHPPIIVLTSNRTRDLHDAVKRRCLYRWIDYPTPEREVEIVRRRVRGASETLAVEVANAVASMRDSDVQKPPGIAEAIDWLAALSVLGIEHLDAAAVDLTLGSVLKYDEDQEVIRAAGLERARAQRWLTRSGWRRSTSTCRRSPGRSDSVCAPPACRSPPSAPPGSRAPSRWCGRTAAGGCTGPPARCSCRTSPRCGPSTRSSARSSAAPRRPTDAQADDERPVADRGTAPAARAQQGGQAAAASATATCRTREDADESEVEVPLALASDEERLAGKRFDALEPDELAQLYRLMSRLRARHAAAAHPPLRARAPRRAHRHAAHAARQPALGRRPDPPGAPAPAHRPPPARDAVRHLGLDGALRARLPPVPGLRRRQRSARRGVRVRHAAHPADPRARLAPPGAGDPARRGRGAGLVERDPDRRRAEGVQRPPRAPRHGARRGGRDPLGRLGARRPAARRARDGAPLAARPPDRLGQPARERAAGSRCAPAGWWPRSSTATRS